VFVAGESGVGKTRLVSELERRATEHDARVLSGDCVELGEGELPYAPLVAALRPLARTGDPALGDLSAGARAELATLLPELGDPAARPRAEEERGAAQLRLFESLLGLLDRLAEDQPLVLVLEDIHWADRSTRSFLTFLAASLGSERIVVVLTYRSDELHRRHPLRPLLAELERAPSARRIELRRLDRDELACQLADIVGAKPDPELLDRMYRRSEGNPLFAEELLAAGTDGRGSLPPTLREALMVRVERLSPTAQEVLRVLAAAGRADHTLLADASGVDARELREALREAAAGQIVVADAEGRYGFRHALLREVVYDDLLPGEHAELHLALAGALERRAAEASRAAWISAGIAHHYFSAGDQPAALRASVVAAYEAERVHAHGEEAALLERALELWDRVPDAEELAGATRSEIFARAARAHMLGGDDARAATLLERALQMLEESLDHRQLALLLGGLAEAYRQLGRGEEGRETLRRALDLLPADEASPQRVHLLAEQVATLMLQGRYRECVDAAREALPAAEEARDEAERGLILNRMGTALIAIGEEEEGTAALREAIDIARREDDRYGYVTGFLNLADSLELAGRAREAEQVIAEHEGSLAAEDDRSASWVAHTRAGLAFQLGDWDRAQALVDAFRARTGTTLVNEDLRRTELALGRGEHAEARRLLDELDRLLDSSLEPQYISPTGELRAELERREGNLDAARAAVEDALDRIEFCSEDSRRVAQIAAAGAAVEADVAQRARDLGEPDVERDAISRAEIHLMRVEAAAGEAGPVEVARLAGAEAEVERARRVGGDPEKWAAASDGWAAIERPYQAALARWREAEAHLAAGDRDAAGRAAATALDAARRLGATWLANELDGLVARGRLRLDTTAPQEAGSEDDEEPFGLTPRERQVLSLVSAGATNREIGAQLYMAEKTASVHVSRILAKLGVRSRTEAAAFAHRHGLS
jgi:DNA-binding CsgD family transcriptional regulator/tetratricopeptide (TPR) repeat protein